MTDTPVLPLVDISLLESDRLEDRLAVAGELDRASSQAGFLYIKGTQFDPALFRKLHRRAESYFAQGQDAKMKSYIGLSENHSGYVPIGEEQFDGGSFDLKEAYDINCDYRLESGRRPLLGPNLWPDMPGFREDVLAYYSHLTMIGRQLFRAFALALGLDEAFFDPHLRHPPSQLRMIHYPFDANARDQHGIGAHTDYECFTLLFATRPGLQVVDRQGEWIDVPLIEDTMIMNIGDMMEMMSNGRYVATKHRVKKVREERYSFPLFFACDYDFRVSPLIGDEAPRYAPIRCGEHIYDQTARTFAYLQRRIAVGNLSLPGNATPRAFGRQATDADA